MIFAVPRALSTDRTRVPCSICHKPPGRRSLHGALDSVDDLRLPRNGMHPFTIDWKFFGPLLTFLCLLNRASWIVVRILVGLLAPALDHDPERHQLNDRTSFVDARDSGSAPLLLRRHVRPDPSACWRRDPGHCRAAFASLYYFRLPDAADRPRTARYGTRGCDFRRSVKAALVAVIDFRCLWAKNMIGRAVRRGPRDPRAAPCTRSLALRQQNNGALGEGA
jgi:hypothetical protein